MIVIIMGASESNRNNFARFLAESLGWEFADTGHLGSARWNRSDTWRVPLTEADGTTDFGTLSAALQCWSYRWQDVVLSCSNLTEEDRKKLSDRYSSVRFVFLKTVDAMEQNDAHMKHQGSASEPGILMGEETCSAQHFQPANMLVVDVSQKADRIVAKVISALILNERSHVHAESVG